MLANIFSRNQLAHSALKVALFVATSSGLASASHAQTKLQKGAVVRDSISGTLVRFEMVYVPGSQESADKPAIKPFLVGRTEVSWDMYDVFMLRLDSTARSPKTDAISRPSMPYAVPDYDWGHAGFAAISITYQAAERFAEWLSEKTGHRYRLPTPQEWEHVAKLATQNKPLSAARVDSIAWHRDNSNETAHAIASRSPDALGLFDLFGNVTEWVQSPENQRITMGGSFRDEPSDFAPTFRRRQTPLWTERDPQLPSSRWWLTDGPFVGFRLVREL